ncbi:MAG: polysaccharide deacetylase family protein [Acidobacteriota bacterium]|nr:polysaccharide deacetylase family protein [Acidobacteriota bacterium]
MNPWLIGGPVALAAGAAATTYGAVNPHSDLFGPVIWRTNSPRKLAVTFDDGPNPKITTELLNLLDRYGARATFFVIGRFARECPGVVRETADRGHVVANHTANHVNLFWRTPSAIQDEIQRCNEAIFAATGAPARWFRPPFGMRNPWVITEAKTQGLGTVLWTRLPGDWRAKTAEWLIKRMDGIAKRAQSASPGGKHPETGSGDILCLHDGDHRFLNGDRAATIAALQYWLPRWRDLGLEFVTIDEAVSAPAR